MGTVTILVLYHYQVSYSTVLYFCIQVRVFYFSFITYVYTSIQRCPCLCVPPMKVPADMVCTSCIQRYPCLSVPPMKVSADIVYALCIQRYPCLCVPSMKASADMACIFISLHTSDGGHSVLYVYKGLHLCVYLQ